MRKTISATLLNSHNAFSCFLRAGIASIVCSAGYASPSVFDSALKPNSIPDNAQHPFSDPFGGHEDLFGEEDTREADIWKQALKYDFIAQELHVTDKEREHLINPIQTLTFIKCYLHAWSKSLPIKILIPSSSPIRSLKTMLETANPILTLSQTKLASRLAKLYGENICSADQEINLTAASRIVNLHIQVLSAP